MSEPMQPTPANLKRAQDQAAYWRSRAQAEVNMGLKRIYFDHAESWESWLRKTHRPAPLVVPRQLRLVEVSNG